MNQHFCLIDKNMNNKSPYGSFDDLEEKTVKMTELGKQLGDIVLEHAHCYEVECGAYKLVIMGTNQDYELK